MTEAKGARSTIPPAATARKISTREFELFQVMIHREAGIYLSPAKRDLLVNRLAPRMRELGLDRFEDYYRLTGEDAAERTHMLDRVSTNETQFFREPRHFEYLESQVYPEWRARAELGQRRRTVRVWSSACSSGEEPYSIAMSLLTHLGGGAWNLSVLGSDLSTRVLDKAERALWPLDRASQIPPAYLKTFMLRGTRTQEGKMKAGPELRAVVELRRFNLMTPSYPFRDSFDVIFCRNVLIYFDVETRRHVLEQLADCLAPDGVLLLGHAETACGLTPRLRAIMPSVYARSSPGGAR